MPEIDLQALADRQAITDALYRYGRALDRMDYALALTVWHEDGLADYGEDIYQGTGHGFIDYCFKVHAEMIAHQHLIANIIIELDGDAAASEAYYMSSHRILEGRAQADHDLRAVSRPLVTAPRALGDRPTAVGGRLQ